MTASQPSPSSGGPRDPAIIGLWAALGAFLVWGLVTPLYFKWVAEVDALELVAHRVVWTVVPLGALLLAQGRGWEVVRALAGGRRLAVFLATTSLISGNWLIFIHAVAGGRLVEASLGYYINPLVNVLLGVVFLGERLSGRKWLAVAVAALGVGWLVAARGGVPWVALALAFSFGFYALLRKTARVDPLVGLFVETGLMLVPALGYLAWLGAEGAFFSRGLSLDGALMLAGPVTAVPLILFMAGAARLSLSTIGILQYLAPTGHLLLGVFAFGEPFTRAHAISFTAIWLALVLYSLDAFARRAENA